MAKHKTGIKKTRHNEMDIFSQELLALDRDRGKARTVPELRKWLVCLLTAAAKLATIQERLELVPPDQREQIRDVLENAPGVMIDLLTEAADAIGKIKNLTEGGDN